MRVTLLLPGWKEVIVRVSNVKLCQRPPIAHLPNVWPHRAHWHTVPQVNCTETRWNVCEIWSRRQAGEQQRRFNYRDTGLAQNVVFIAREWSGVSISSLELWAMYGIMDLKYVLFAMHKYWLVHFFTTVLRLNVDKASIELVRFTLFVMLTPKGLQ